MGTRDRLVDRVCVCAVCSRARTLAGMHITGLTRRCVRASAVALDFYKRSSLI